MKISALQLFKSLPRTNCGECGIPTCLAFATQVVVEGTDLSGCPYLSPEAQALAETITMQQQNGVGRKRDNFAIALNFLEEKVAPLDFAALAAGLGADYGEENGRPYLKIRYFGREVKVFKDEVRYPPGIEENPWDAILLYNYIASQGQRPPCGEWIKFQGLPNSVSKTKTLLRLQKQLAEAFNGKIALLRQKALEMGGKPVTVAQDADLQFLFQPLPRLPLLLVFHDAEPEENFEAEAHFLFDAQVMDYLDLESLLFLVERLLDQLMEKYE
jgi:Domain of unknown function (DUF3786)/Putative Fe-S cluster